MTYNHVMPRRRAFTLVELLVVIAILCLLLAMLTPTMQRAREFTRRSVCNSQVHQLLAAVHAYAAAHKSILPSGKRNLVGSYAGEHCIWISDALYDTVYAQTNRHDAVICPNLPGFGYQNQYGWVIGYNYLGNHPRMNELDYFRSPVRTSESGDFAVWTDLNNWNPGGWTFVAHTAGGSLGRTWPEYYNMYLGGVYPADAGSEGGNVGYLDGSSRWKNVGEMKQYETGEWGKWRYPCLW